MDPLLSRKTIAPVVDDCIRPGGFRYGKLSSEQPWYYCSASAGVEGSERLDLLCPPPA